MPFKRTSKITAIATPARLLALAAITTKNEMRQEPVVDDTAYVYNMQSKLDDKTPTTELGAKRERRKARFNYVFIITKYIPAGIVVGSRD